MRIIIFSNKSQKKISSMLDSGCLILEKSFTAEIGENTEILSFFINRGLAQISLITRDFFILMEIAVFAIVWFESGRSCVSIWGS